MAITGIRDPKGERAKADIGRISCAPVTAEVVRKVARHLDWTLDQLLVAMLEDWVPRNTSLVLEHGDAEPSTAERRGGERRGTEKPVPGSSDERVNRRKAAKGRRSND